jgi:hypothetical protein
MTVKGPGSELLRARSELRRGDQNSLGSAFVQHRALKVTYGSWRNCVAESLDPELRALPPRIGSGSVARTSIPSPPECSVVITSIPICLKSAATRSSKSIGPAQGDRTAAALSSSGRCGSAANGQRGRRGIVGLRPLLRRAVDHFGRSALICQAETDRGRLQGPWLVNLCTSRFRGNVPDVTTDALMLREPAAVRADARRKAAAGG